MSEGESQSFWRSRPSLFIRLALSAVGVLLFIVGLQQPFERTWPVLSAGALLVAFGLGGATRPVFVITPEGLVVVRGGLRGIDKLIRWTSIRGLQRLGDDLLALELLDQSWTRIRVGPLAVDDRDRLVAEIGRVTGHG